VATVASVSTTGTADQRVTASSPVATGSFLTNLQSRSSAAWAAPAENSSPTTPRSTLGTPNNGASSGPAALSPSAPLFSTLIAAALRQDQEVQGFVQAAQTGAAATKAYLATGDRNRTETARTTNLAEILSPGMPPPQASGRLLDVVA